MKAQVKKFEWAQEENNNVAEHHYMSVRQMSDGRSLA
jgi:hypothetical protein